MNIEYEATFFDIDKEEMRRRLEGAGAMLARPECIQRRMNFHLPKEKRNKDAWLRVRDEGDKTTLSLKIIDGDRIENQKELCLEVGDFSTAAALLEAIGCERKSYQETKRELWTLEGADITIDEWPFLEPFVEVEGKSSESAVRRVSEKLGFGWAQAKFCAVNELYGIKYGVEPEKVSELERLVFDMENPFVPGSKKKWVTFCPCRRNRHFSVRQHGQRRFLV